MPAGALNERLSDIFSKTGKMRVEGMSGRDWRSTQGELSGQLDGRAVSAGSRVGLRLDGRAEHSAIRSPCFPPAEETQSLRTPSSPCPLAISTLSRLAPTPSNPSTPHETRKGLMEKACGMNHCSHVSPLQSPTPNAKRHDYSSSSSSAAAPLPAAAAAAARFLFTRPGRAPP